MTQQHEVVTRRDQLAISGPVFREFIGKLANMEFPIENNRAKSKIQFTEMNVIDAVAGNGDPFTRRNHGIDRKSCYELAARSASTVKNLRVVDIVGMPNAGLSENVEVNGVEIRVQRRLGVSRSMRQPVMGQRNVF